MKRIDNENNVVLTPDEGMWLYNGEIFCSEVSTIADRVNEWQEVTDEFKQSTESMEGENDD